MTALWIALASIGGLILLVILLILIGTAKVRIRLEGKPNVTVSVLGIRFTLLSDKEKEGANKDLSRCRAPGRALKKELRRQRKAAAKAEKKKRKAAAKAAEKAARKKEKKALAKTVPQPNLKENIDMILALLKKLYEVTKGRVRVRVKRLLISVGTDDAAKTAVLYGATVASVASIIGFIDQKFTRIRRRSGEMQVRADYLSGKTHAEIDIICSIRLYRALVIGVKMLLTWRRERATALEKAATRAELADEATESKKK